MQQRYISQSRSKVTFRIQILWRLRAIMWMKEVIGPWTTELDVNKILDSSAFFTGIAPENHSHDLHELILI